MQNTIDEDADEKFRCSNECCAKQTSEKERHAHHFSIYKADHCEAEATRYDHRRMRISSPHYLKQTVSDAADEHTDDAIFPLSPEASLSEVDFAVSFQVRVSFSMLRFASFFRYSIASESPPISSIRPRLTASFPSMIAPTSVASSSVR